MTQLCFYTCVCHSVWKNDEQYGAGVIPYFHPPYILTLGLKYRNNIFTPGWRYQGGENIVSHRFNTFAYMSENLLASSIKQTDDDEIRWYIFLTHCGLVTLYGNIEHGQYWFMILLTTHWNDWGRTRMRVWAHIRHPIAHLCIVRIWERLISLYMFTFLQNTAACNGLNTVKSLNIRHALIGYEIVHHSDIVEASPVGAAPTTSSFST